jgi:hypothetical protein
LAVRNMKAAKRATMNPPKVILAMKRWRFSPVQEGLLMSCHKEASSAPCGGVSMNAPTAFMSSIITVPTRFTATPRLICRPLRRARASQLYQ